MHKRKYLFRVQQNSPYIITSDKNMVCSFFADRDYNKITLIAHKPLFYYTLNNHLLIITCESECKLKIINKDYDISQIKISRALTHFSDDIFLFKNLRDYNNPYEPSYFFGMYKLYDLKILQKHKALKIIIWGGSDIIYSDPSAKAIIDSVCALPRVKMIATTSFIKNDLDLLKMSYKLQVFINLEYDKFKPVKKGNCIFIYDSPFADDKKYGRYLYTRLIKKYPNIKFILTCNQVAFKRALTENIALGNFCSYTKDELINKIYPQCFVGLRLTDHDSTAFTVQEAGLMGIKSIHNGDSPCCLKYKTFEDICNHIENEEKKINECDIELAAKVKKYLTLPKNFFNTSFFYDESINCK